MTAEDRRWLAGLGIKCTPEPTEESPRSGTSTKPRAIAMAAYAAVTKDADRILTRLQEAWEVDRRRQSLERLRAQQAEVAPCQLSSDLRNAQAAAERWCRQAGTWYRRYDSARAALSLAATVAALEFVTLALIGLVWLGRSA